MPALKFLQTTDNVGLDRELEDLRRLLTAAQKAIMDLHGKVAAQVPTTTAQAATPLSQNLTNFQVQDVAGAIIIPASFIAFDTTDAFAVSATAGGGARIDRTPSVVTPPAIAAAGSAGTSPIPANQDHTHAALINTKLLYSDFSVPGGNTVANTLTETVFTSSFTIAGNTLQVGDAITIDLFGLYGTGLVAPTLTGKLKIGAVTVLTTGAITTIGSLTSQGWFARLIIGIASIGATGSLECQGFAEFATAATTGLSVNMTNTAPATIDTTVSEAFTVTITWGIANASDTIQLRQMVATLLR